MLNWNYIPEIGEIVYAKREGENKRFVVLPQIGQARRYPSVTLWEVIGFGDQLSKVCCGDDVKDAWEAPYSPACNYKFTVLHGNKLVNLFNSPLILYNE